MQKLKDKVRNEILTAAASEFNQKGFQEASMRNIASKADITPGNIYRYFQNKETLLKAVVLPVMEEINQTLVECTDNKFNIFTKNQAFVKDSEDFWVNIHPFAENLVRIYQEKQDVMEFIAKNENYRNLLKEWLKDALNRYFLAKKQADAKVIDILSSVAAVSMIDSITECLQHTAAYKDTGLNESNLIEQCIITILAKEEEMI